MNKPSSNAFDCVQSMRQARDTLNSDIESMTFDDLVNWLRDHPYSDPLLQRLADKAAQHAEAHTGRAT